MRLFACLAVFGLMAATPALSAQKDYNGRWAIHATTDRGQCVKGFKLSIRIAQGRAYMIGKSLNGTKSAISSRGNVSIRYVSGKDVITAIGKLKGQYGTGSWSFPNYRCTGRWRAERM